MAWVFICSHGDDCSRESPTDKNPDQIAAFLRLKVWIETREKENMLLVNLSSFSFGDFFDLPELTGESFIKTMGGLGGFAF